MIRLLETGYSCLCIIEPLLKSVDHSTVGGGDWLNSWPFHSLRKQDPFAYRLFRILDHLSLIPFGLFILQLNEFYSQTMPSFSGSPL